MLAGIPGVAIAQQDPQFTQFMYNKLIYNPGYAGTSGAVCGVAQYRQQWSGFDGAPSTFALAGDMKMQGLPLGIGVNLITDKIGGMSTTFFRLAGSYNITKLAGGTLGLGIDVGLLQKKMVNQWITPESYVDPRIPGSVNNGSYVNPDFSKLSYDVGFGAFYQIPGKFYAGISSTHLPAQALTDGQATYKMSRHYYVMTGYTFQLNKWSKLTPNILYKTDVAASSLDLNLTYLWSDMVWVGGTYRINDAAAALIGFQGKAGAGNVIGYKIGYSYDFTASKIASYSKGSHEIILSVCYTPKIKRPTSYSDPRFL